MDNFHFKAERRTYVQIVWYVLRLFLLQIIPTRNLVGRTVEIVAVKILKFYYRYGLLSSRK